MKTFVHIENPFFLKTIQYLILFCLLGWIHIDCIHIQKIKTPPNKIVLSLKKMYSYTKDEFEIRIEKKTHKGYILGVFVKEAEKELKQQVSETTTIIIKKEIDCSLEEDPFFCSKTTTTDILEHLGVYSRSYYDKEYFDNINKLKYIPLDIILIGLKYISFPFWYPFQYLMLVDEIDKKTEIEYYSENLYVKEKIFHGFIKLYFLNTNYETVQMVMNGKVELSLPIPESKEDIIFVSILLSNNTWKKVANFKIWKNLKKVD